MFAAAQYLLRTAWRPGLRQAGYGAGLLICSQLSIAGPANTADILRNPFLPAHNPCQNNWQHWQYQGLVQQGSRVRALLHHERPPSFNPDTRNDISSDSVSDNKVSPESVSDNKLSDSKLSDNKLSHNTHFHNTHFHNNSNGWLRVSAGEALPGGGMVLHLAAEAITLSVGEHCPVVTLSFLHKELHYAQTTSSDFTVSVNAFTVADPGTRADSQRPPDASASGKTASQ